MNRGGIDERWFASTTPAANEDRTPDEGLSYVVVGKHRFTLLQAVAECGSTLIGEALWAKYGKWPVYSKFFDNMGPIPHHMHQNAAQAAFGRAGGQARVLLFPAAAEHRQQSFPLYFHGVGARHHQGAGPQVSGALEQGRQWHPRPLEGVSPEGWLGLAYQPCVLHAPGSLCTYEPQWGSDVFAMFQNLVEGRLFPWSQLVKDMPEEHHDDLDFIVEQLDWDGNVDPRFKENHYLEPVPVADTRSEGYADRWIVYGKVDGEQLFTAKELTVEPGVKATIKDAGAHGLVCVQGTGKINGRPLKQPGAYPVSPTYRGRIFRYRGWCKSGYIL